jgi:hypothetical protein
MSTDTLKKISKSPVTGVEYEIPELKDDKAGIDAFVAMHPAKKVVVVQGLVL